MKKIITLIVSLFILTGCSSGKTTQEQGKLTQEQGKNIEIGMSEKEVKKELGEPKSQTTDKEKISEDIHSLIKILQDALNKGGSREMENRISKLNYIDEMSENGAVVKEYIYELDENVYGLDNNIYGLSPLYFIEGKLKFINGQERE